MRRRIFALALFLSGALAARGYSADLRDDAERAMRRAAVYYRETVASHGGYVYHYVLDEKGAIAERYGEGKATADQIWVQPPGTPSVGRAYLAAYRATADRYYLDAARAAAEALVYGQLRSGGWTYAIDFDPQGKRVAQYRGAAREAGDKKRKLRNVSTLDDGVSQSAISFLIETDRALDFKDAKIHEAARAALDALLAAQFPNGAFPQAWTGPVERHPVVKAQYPDYDWRTENRIKDYWDLYTLNDNLAGHVADTLLVAAEVYGDKRCGEALERLGDFLILAQMPEPQPAWAQQYDYKMRPVWARRFEPPAITAGESQDAIATLMKIHRHTGDAKHLAPIPRALAYLKKSRLAEGGLARFYELRTNKPLYMTREYELTYDDGDVPTHYGWKVGDRLDALSRGYADLAAGRKPAANATAKDAERLAKDVRAIVDALDDEGRWVTKRGSGGLVGQPKIEAAARIVSSDVFVKRMETLARFVQSAAGH